MLVRTKHDLRAGVGIGVGDGVVGGGTEIKETTSTQNMGDKYYAQVG